MKSALEVATVLGHLRQIAQLLPFWRQHLTPTSARAIRAHPLHVPKGTARYRLRHRALCMELPQALLGVSRCGRGRSHSSGAPRHAPHLAPTHRPPHPKRASRSSLLGRILPRHRRILLRAPIHVAHVHQRPHHCRDFTPKHVTRSSRRRPRPSRSSR